MSSLSIIYVPSAPCLNFVGFHLRSIPNKSLGGLGTRLKFIGPRDWKRVIIILLSTSFMMDTEESAEHTVTQVSAEICLHTSPRSITDWESYTIMNNSMKMLCMFARKIQYAATLPI